MSLVVPIHHGVHLNQVHQLLATDKKPVGFSANACAFGCLSIMFYVCCKEKGLCYVMVKFPGAVGPIFYISLLFWATFVPF